MATYYISKAGNDSNTGLSVAQAFKTWAQAASMGISNNTFYFDDGGFFDETMSFSGEGNFRIYFNNSSFLFSTAGAVMRSIRLENCSDFVMEWPKTFGGNIRFIDCFNANIESISAYEAVGDLSEAIDGMDGAVVFDSCEDITATADVFSGSCAYRPLKGTAEIMAGFLIVNTTGLISYVESFYAPVGIICYGTADNTIAGNLTLIGSSLRSKSAGIVLLNKDPSNYRISAINCTAADTFCESIEIDGEDVAGEVVVLHKGGKTRVINTCGWSKAGTPLVVKDDVGSDLYIDNNNWKSETTSVVVQDLNHGSFTSLGAWRNFSSFDLNSFSVNPGFEFIEAGDPSISVMSPLYNLGDASVADASHAYAGSACIGYAEVERYRSLTIYVRESGNDSNDGLTAATAVRTPYKAMALINAADDVGTIVIGASDYTTVEYSPGVDGGVVLPSAPSRVLVLGDTTGTLTGDSGDVKLKSVYGILYSSRVIAKNIQVENALSSLFGSIYLSSCTGVASSGIAGATIHGGFSTVQSEIGRAQIAHPYNFSVSRTSFSLLVLGLTGGQTFRALMMSSCKVQHLVSSVEAYQLGAGKRMNLGYLDIVQSMIYSNEELDASIISMIYHLADTSLISYGLPSTKTHDAEQERLYKVRFHGSLVVLNYVPTSAVFRLFYSELPVSLITDGSIQADKNVYWRDDGGNVMTTLDGDMSLAVYSTAYSQEVASLFEDPLFVDA